VSVVVAAYDAAGVIGACLRSLLDLDYPKDRLEVIVVDNGSRDETAAIVRACARDAILASEPRRGAAAARNRGIALARGEVVAFTDADCVVESDWLAALVTGLVDPEVGVAGGRIRALRPCSRIAALGEDLHDHRRAMQSTPPYAITMNWASPKAVLDAVGGFDESFLRCQDVDLAFRIVQAGYRLAYVDQAVVHHRNRATVHALLREARQHGRGAVAVRRAHAAYLSRFPAARSYPERILSSLRGLRDVRRLDLRLVRLLFEVGKISGELWPRP
jgi:cellulose synthase/poly-beta-1,6-N-acetylglucosamine synthase-like glycosyltransferase